MDALKRPGVIEMVASYQAIICASASKRQISISLDPEVASVIHEMPWEEQRGINGLQRLRKAIEAAFAWHERSQSVNPFVTIDDFRQHGDEFRQHGSVQDNYNGPLGFMVRGRRLYRILEEDQSPLGQKASSTWRQAMDYLQATHRLLTILID